MRVLLLGATGLIGSAVAARLAGAGHDVTGVARMVDAPARRVPVGRWVRIDLREATSPQDWLPHLAGIDAVVNCAGVLQDNLRDSTARVHREAPSALWAACREAGVARIVQVSAIGVDRAAPTLFSRTKKEGDGALEASGLDWVILRPSVVVGRPAYGGTALIRALAALPLVPRFPEAGPADVVMLDDVAETVLRLLAPGAATHVALELAGPERLAFAGIVAAFRRWLGWSPAREVAVPGFLLAAAWRAGDVLAWLGWRPPVRSTVRREIARGAIGDGTAWREATGIVPQRLADALAASPATVQERWFARLYLLKPVALAAFALFWLATGLVSLGPARDEAIRMMEATAAARWAGPAVIGGALFDVAMGIALMARRTARPALIAAFFATLAYLFAGTWLMPSLWADPLGPLMKIVPILALNLVCLAILDDR